MRIFKVELRFPEQTELVLVPLAVAGSAVVGSFIQKATQGSMAPVAGMAFAGGMATFMTLAGGNFDSGWRGVALTLAATYTTFLAAMVLYPLL